VLARNAEKAASLFDKTDHLDIVEGEYSTMDKFKESIKEHKRMSLLVSGFSNMQGVKA
jgi:hypothetical protein